jgi:PAS domain S-box-containing protein
VRRHGPGFIRRGMRKERLFGVAMLCAACWLTAARASSAQPPGEAARRTPAQHQFWFPENRRVAAGVAIVFGLETALVVGLLVERTRRRRAEVAWRASEARYRDVVDTQNELICRFLPDTTLTFVNDAYCRFWMKQREDLLGTKFLDFVPKERRDEVRRRIHAVVEEPGVVSHEHEVLLPNGSIGWQQWTNHRLVDERGRVTELQAVGRDVSERKRTEQELRTTGAALRESYQRVEDLAGRLIASQEAERTRIARDLHDDLSQKLALLSVEIEQLPRHPAEQLSDRVRFIAERAGEIATDVHHLAYQLHPAKLESLGLVSAMTGYCRDISSQHALKVSFTHRHLPTDVAPDVALCLYRVMQEALHNVIRHSGTREASVDLSVYGGALEMRIADPGRGFSPAAQDRTGLGLVSMRERVNFIGGAMVIHTAPGAGTRIGVRVPIERARAAAPCQPPGRMTARNQQAG